jgi:hypothetical protein
MEDYNLNYKAMGVLFRRLTCFICNKGVSHKHSASGAFVFDCHRQTMSGLNHVYHSDCLRNFIHDELKRDKKASVKEADIFSNLRCVACYPASQDISGSASSKLTMYKKKKSQDCGVSHLVNRMSNGSGISDSSIKFRSGSES